MGVTDINVPDNNPLAQSKKDNFYQAYGLIATACNGIEEDTPDNVRHFIRFLLEGLEPTLAQAIQDIKLVSPSEGYDEWREHFYALFKNDEYFR